MKKSKIKINLNINKEDDDFLYIWGQFNDRPNKVKYYNSYFKGLFDENLKDFIIDKKISREVIPADEFDIVNDKIFAKITSNIFLSYIVYDSESEVSYVTELTFLFKEEEEIDVINKIVSLLEPCMVDFEESDSSSNLNTLSVGPDGIDIEPLILPEIDDSVEMFYNSKTFKHFNKLTKSINKSEKGLSIIYGERGTGKTSIIKYLSTKVDRMIVYIPNLLLEATINSPEFRSFLKLYEKPIIIIDDCEFIFNDYYSKSNSYTTNILQMLDGLLSDYIMLNLVMIFNSDIDDVDNNLLECNNLLDVIEFEKLDIDESNELSKHLGYNKKFKTNSRLIDIIKKNKQDKEIKIGLN